MDGVGFPRPNPRTTLGQAIGGRTSPFRRITRMMYSRGVFRGGQGAMVPLASPNCRLSGYFTEKQPALLGLY